MAPKKAVQHRLRNFGCRRSVLVSLALSVITPLFFLALRAGNFASAHGHNEFPDWTSKPRPENARRLSAILSQEVLGAISTNPVTTEPLNLNIVGSKDLSSSLVQEETTNVSKSGETNAETDEPNKQTFSRPDVLLTTASGSEGQGVISGRFTGVDGAAVAVDQRQDVPRQQEVGNNKELANASTRRRSQPQNDRKASQSSLLRTLRDHLIMGKAYATLAQSQNNVKLLQELKLQNRELQELLAEAESDGDLPPSAKTRTKHMGQLLDRAKNQLYDCSAMVKKLRAMLHVAEQESRMLKKQSVYLSQLAAKTIPKGLHCLSMRLSVEYYALPPEEREFPSQENLENPDLYHYALFSDNILAASVVVNSTIAQAKEPEKHVFHLVTDKLNYGAMRMWFLANPPGNATIEVQNVDEFKWLNSSYSPVLRQLESANMREYYFRANNPAVSTGLKYRNPKYLSMLNHLRFYLPEIYPKLNKIVFLDDDIVVQKDLAPLWSIDLQGNVNGAVETCGASFHRFDKYLNFSNPLISKNFDPNACGWAYGMNLFDLQRWKEKDITGIYHRWQTMNEDRTLWRLGTLPPGLITFYKLTYPLNKRWHVLGLGYNADVSRKDINNAAVIHYNGNMKPWLEIGMAKYKPYWSRHVKYDHIFLQQCNISE